LASPRNFFDVPAPEKQKTFRGRCGKRSTAILGGGSFERAESREQISGIGVGGPGGSQMKIFVHRFVALTLLFSRPIIRTCATARSNSSRRKRFGDVTVGALLLSPVAIAGGCLFEVTRITGMAPNSALLFSSRQI